MYEIKNVSDETLEILTIIDPSTPGCRIKPLAMPVRQLAPGETETQLGYEPGVSIIVRPAVDPHRSRWPF